MARTNPRFHREPGYCKHGVYVGGCGIDWMCGECEFGDDPHWRDDYRWKRPWYEIRTASGLVVVERGVHGLSAARLMQMIAREQDSTVTKYAATPDGSQVMYVKTYGKGA